MTIYKSSFNKKPDKKENITEKKEKPVKIKPVKEKKKLKVNKPLICLIAFSVVFVMCLFANPVRSFLLGLVGLSVYPISVIGIFFSDFENIS